MLSWLFFLLLTMHVHLRSLCNGTRSYLSCCKNSVHLHATNWVQQFPELICGSSSSPAPSIGPLQVAPKYLEAPVYHCLRPTGLARRQPARQRRASRSSG